jgi:hypothetical protein
MCRDHTLDDLGYARPVSPIGSRSLTSRRVAEKIGMTPEKQTYKWGK